MKYIVDWWYIIDKKISAVVGEHKNYKSGHKVKDVKKLKIRPEYIVFDDGETYIKLKRDASPHDFAARIISIEADADFHKELLAREKYKPATTDLGTIIPHDAEI